MIKLSVGDYVTYTNPAGLISVVKILHFNSDGTVLVKYLNGSTVHVRENSLSLYQSVNRGEKPLFLYSKRGKKMKSAEALYDTICYKCDASDMYSWKVERYNEYDNVVSFDVREKAGDELLCSCGISGFEECDYGSDYPVGRVHFSFYDGCNALELNVEDYKCEVGSIYMNDIIDMAIKMLYR